MAETLRPFMILLRQGWYPPVTHNHVQSIYDHVLIKGNYYVLPAQQEGKLQVTLLGVRWVFTFIYQVVILFEKM